jgi:DNA-binding CsgD family transcriptional regulator
MSLDLSVLAVIETLYDFLDRSPVAIVLLDGQKRVVFANEHAAELHGRGDGITICSSGIGLFRSHDNVRLQGLIARAVGGCGPPAGRHGVRDAGRGRRSLGDEGGLGRRSLGEGRSMRALRSSGKRPYGFIVAPLLLGDRDRDPVRATCRPAVCVVIADPDGARALPVERLQEAFDLTEAESRLAARLAAGEGLRSAAHSLGITYGTARARLAEIFQKTDTRRQGELINLLLTTVGV